jgi:hypothetical protein
MGVKTSIKTGATVKWTSGTKTKKGTVVSVLKKRQDYTSGYNIPQRVYVDILREYNGLTRDQARGVLVDAGYRERELILRQRYKTQFNLLEGMYRDEDHYLIEVPDGERKPYLYHPKAGETFKVLKK